MTTGAKKFQEPTDEEIARYAYHLWESEGCVHGRDMDYWLQAKTHLTMTREYEAGLLKASPQQPASRKSSEARSASSAAETNTRTPKKRQPRSAREPVYA